MGTAKFYLWPGDEFFPSTNAAGGGAWSTENSGASAPTNGQILPRKFLPFDASTDEGVFWLFRLPANYASGGTLTFDWSSNATTGNVVWKSAYVLSTPGTTDFDGLALGTVTAGSASATHGTAGVEKTQTIDLGVTGATVGQKLYVYLGRDADNASDTMSGDAELSVGFFLSIETI